MNILAPTVCSDKLVHELVDDMDQLGPYPGHREIFLDFAKLQTIVLTSMSRRFACGHYYVKKVGNPREMNKEDAVKAVEWVKSKAAIPEEPKPTIAEQIDKRVEEDGAYMVHPLPGWKPKVKLPPASPKRTRPKKNQAVKLPILRGNTGTGTTNWWAV